MYTIIKSCNIYMSGASLTYMYYYLHYLKKIKILLRSFKAIMPSSPGATQGVINLPNWTGQKSLFLIVMYTFSLSLKFKN